MVDSVDEGVVSVFNVLESSIFVSKTLLGSGQVRFGKSESIFSSLNLSLQLDDLVFVVGDGLVFQNVNNLVEVIDGRLELVDGGNVDGGEVVQRLGEVRSQIVKGVNSSLDGRLGSAGLDLHHSLDDGLDEQLVLGLQVLGGGFDLLSEGDEGVLDLDQREGTEISTVVISLSILEVRDGLSNNVTSILVVLDFSLVNSFDGGKVVFVLLQRSLVVRKSLLSVFKTGLESGQLTVEVVQGSFTIGNLTLVVGDISVELSIGSLVRSSLGVE